MPQPDKHTFNGTSGSDTLVGTHKNDYFTGGHGDDFITTGEGADRVYIHPGNGVDVITDFHPVDGDRVVFDEYGYYNDILYLGQLSDGQVIHTAGGDFFVSATDYNHDGITDTLVTAQNGDGVALLGWSPDQLYGWSLMGG